ncbi:MAG: FAD binding domain-containing protein, partial [Acidimicrobiia bacterium]
MMRLPPFRFLEPSSIDEATRILADHGPGATTVAGGTDLYPNLKRRQSSPETLVSLRRIEDLRGIHANGAGTVIGATTVLSHVASGTGLPPALAEAAGYVSSPQIRNVGTIGGNLCVDTRCDYINQNEEWRRAIDFCLKDRGEICWVAPRSSHCWATSSTDVAPAAIALDARVRIAC